MQFTQILSLLAIAPFLAVASPVDAEDFASVNRFPLEARGGIDFCGSDLRSAGGACTFGSGEKDPHACDFNNRQSVVSISNSEPAIPSANNGKAVLQRQPLGRRPQLRIRPSLQVRQEQP
jgi:hypothetical protein